MLNIRTIEELDKNERNLKAEKETHINSGQCTNDENCGECNRIKSRLQDINLIRNDSGARI